MKKLSMKKLSKRGKKILISATALLLVAAIGVGIWLGSRSGADPVGVYPFNNIGMTEFWGDSQESYGPVTTDRIQTVFLTDTQTVTEVKVKQGDTVREGDILLSFDTTLSDLQLERKRLETEKLKLQLEAAEEELKKIRQMVPMEPYDSGSGIPEVTEPPGDPVADLTLWIDNKGRPTGLQPESAIVCWIRDTTQFDVNELLQQLHGKLNLPELCEHIRVRESCELCRTCVHGKVRSECPICNPEICEHDNIRLACPLCNPCVHGLNPEECEICRPTICEHGNIARYCPTCHPCVHGKDPAKCKICSPTLCPHNKIYGMCDECNLYPGMCEHGILRSERCDLCNPPVIETDPPETTAETTANGLSASEPYQVIFLRKSDAGDEDTQDHGCGHYLVFKMTQGNTDLSSTVFWQGVYLYHQDGRVYTHFYTPVIQDYTIPETEEEEDVQEPSLDFTIGYTAKELAEMRKDQEKKIKELTFNLNMAEAEYKIMARELSDGNIYADFDGEVVSLISDEESRETKQPMVKVSGGGGFYIEGSVSELEKDRLLPGQEVTVNDWNTGGSYTGTVKSIGDFPTSDGSWSGMGNPTATYYPFTAFVSGDANLQAGSYVSVQYSTSGSQNGIYLDKAFVRTEQGQSYVFVQGADQRLEKRVVTTGKSLWGSYLEILSGLTPEDKLAFPYGKNVKEGAKTVESDLSSLYMY